MSSILVFEDSILQGKIIIDLLTENGHDTTLATTGEEGFNRLKEKEFDLILLDMVLPDYSGISLIRKINELIPEFETPIIVLSGLTDKENIIESLGMGINDYITKPFHPKELINRINIHLKLRNSYKRIKKVNEANDKFLSIMGHDLKDGFSAMFSGISLLERTFSSDATISKDMIVTEVLESAKQVNHLLDQLVTWGKMINSGIINNPEYFNINLAIEKVGNKLKPTIDAKNIDFVLDCNEDFEVFADLNEIETTIRNIISNARNFTPEKGTITVRTKSIEKEDKNYVVVSISDTGIGMKEEDLNNLFTSTHNVPSKNLYGNMGTGLGLSISKQLTEHNGGYLTIESEYGKGSTIHIAIPAEKQN